MSTYSNDNSNDTVYLGTDFKVNVHMDNIDGYSMDDVDFTCVFYTNSKKKVVLLKDDMIPIRDGNYVSYVAPLESKDLGQGVLKIVYGADIPDNDFDDGLRHEVVPITTGIKIV